MIPAWTSSIVADPGDHPAEQHHRQVRRVLPDPVVAQRHQLVAGRRQPHHAVAVHRARLQST